MIVRNYMKKNAEREKTRINKSMTLHLCNSSRSKKHLLGLSIALVLLLLSVVMFSLHRNNNSDLEVVDGIELMKSPLGVASSKKEVISIPSGTVKANPFVPYRIIDDSVPILDVPTYALVEPPEGVSEGSDAARVMDTIVSGILYDKASPSAILNIEGNDYLVKKGDVVNNYKVVNITQDAVTVKLGSNTYSAGIGEILSYGEVNYNEVSNLNKKFGGKR